MRLIAKNVPVSLDAILKENPKMFSREIARSLGVKSASISDVTIERRSVDARKKNNVHFVLNVSFEPKLDKPLGFWRDRAKRGVSIDPFEKPPAIDIPRVPVSSPSSGSGRAPMDGDAFAGGSDSGGPDAPIGKASDVDHARPVVVGAGPAGLFCALYLARAGMRPLLIERGQPVERRIRSVKEFAEGGVLDPESNIQFGEGGAGTFSDGKLNTGTKSPFNRFVLEEFVSAGAPQDILIDAKPHIGTDYLVGVVANLRKRIIDAGGEVLFSTKLVDIDLDGSRCISSILVEDPTGIRSIPTDTLVLACGHSARDTFELMVSKDVVMERKPFAMGVRIEHPQTLINAIQYGAFAGHAALPPADYKLAVRTSTGRGVYSFCMCPGGEVVAAASEVGGLCVNGMSDHARAGKSANSALLVEVSPDDLEGDDVLEGVRLQREFESRAFKLGGSNYEAPVQRLSDFLPADSIDMPKHLRSFPKVKPTYPRGTVLADLDECLPSFISNSLREGIVKMDARMRGFAYPDACLTAIEARSSSPVRIVRDRVTLRSVNTDGLYPTGEGAGYAGGIMSAATDGLRVAKRIVEQVILDHELTCAIDALRGGRAVIFPTDTVYGIGMSLSSDPATDFIFRAKGRSEDKPLQWLVGSASDIDRYASEVHPYVRKLVEAFWPGGLTIVVKASPDIDRRYVAKDGTIGIRMPADEVALKLIDRLGSPMIATSANRSGSPSAATMAELDREWADQLGIPIVNGSSDGKHASADPVASTVVDCTGDLPKIIREGSISVEDMMAAI